VQGENKNMRNGFFKFILLLLSILFLGLGLFHAPKTIDRMSDVYIEEIETSTSAGDINVAETTEKAVDVATKGMIYIGVMFLLSLLCFLKSNSMD
jgi:hypothetical protein